MLDEGDSVELGIGTTTWLAIVELIVDTYSVEAEILVEKVTEVEARVGDSVEELCWVLVSESVDVW